MHRDPDKTRAALLRCRGLVFASTGEKELADRYLQAVEIELAHLGYVPSARLRARLARQSRAELTRLQKWMGSTLAAVSGADREHRPLFRKFPRGIPRDTRDLWIRKVLGHFLQEVDQPCLHCRRVGTTHVLSPCLHVVCDRCFDGASYSACPICEHRVDPSSPFFLPSPDRGLPEETVRLKLLDLGDRLEDSARELFLLFCGRTQAMSPDDRDDFRDVVRDFAESVLSWLPPAIPVRENVAIVLGTLLTVCPPEAVLEHGAGYLASATDVLRMIAEFSGADPSLQGEMRFVTTEVEPGLDPLWTSLARRFGLVSSGARVETVYQPVKVRRFGVARLARPLRRALLTVLEGFDPDRLAEDMLRHRSYWVWLGEFLHPHEHARRLPNVARAFALVRKKAPDGTKAPAFRGYYGKLEAAFEARDVSRALELLLPRPGELARRFDHLLRLAGDEPDGRSAVLSALLASLGAVSNPVLLTLRSILPTRLTGGGNRVYWPKGGTAGGILEPDRRAPLPADVVRPAVAAIERELLRRFAAEAAVDDWVIDRSLRTVMAPFNERTASRSAVALPRGSRVDVPPGKIVRMFLHWCEPESEGRTTDLDLSVGFYDEDWVYVGVCSYYELRFGLESGRDIATSAGDLQSAPPPDGSTEFIDLHRQRARAVDIRYAVMVVTAYAGLPFSQLDRAFAGTMLRDDPDGAHFDPRTVDLRFALSGARGVYLPLVLDIVDNRLHWLDLYSRGELLFNNVETANRDIARICPAMIDYFGSGARTSMYELALLHAAARARRVYFRDGNLRMLERVPGEDAVSFLRRLETREDAVPDGGPPGSGLRSVSATLFRGDLELPDHAERYVLFPEKVAGTIAASDLIGPTAPDGPR